MLKFMKKYWPFAILASAFMIAEVSVDMWQPRLMADIVDNGILGLNGDGTPDIPLITSVGIKMILVVLLGGVCGMLSGLFANLCSQNFANDIRKTCFDRVMHLSFQQTDQFTTGSLVTRITNDVSQIERLVQQLVRGFIRCFMFMIVGTITLLSLNQNFLVVIICAFPLIILDIFLVLRKTSPLFTEVQNKLDTVNTVIQENIGGARVVKAFVQEGREKQRFAGANQDLVDTQLKVLLTMSVLRPAMNIILNLATVALIRIGAIQVEAGAMQPGEVMAGVTYISQILSGMMMLAMIFQVITRGMASGRRLKEILDTEPAIQSGSYDGSSKTDAPAIEFRNVSFSYPDASERILEDINLSIYPGETVGIIGATGSGKTSLVNLIPRFYDATAGQVLVNGVDVKDYDLTYLRDQVAFLTQKNELFSTTIRENIAIGGKNASDDDIQAAAGAAQAAEFIEGQPDGYDTAVAEKGASLSGGQRQRIAIARALLKHSPIMIFDDSTSALDLKAEAALYDALGKDFDDVTKIVIAQRVATIQYADKIAVLDAGKIAAWGTHEELLKSSPIYQDIYNSQLGKGDAA